MVTTSGQPGSSHKPVVIPQTTKSFKGVFYSPFIRAYAPGLAADGIPQDVFIKFIDDFNESFVAHPAFTVASRIGQTLGTAGQALPPVAWAGQGLQAASMLSSAGVSYARARSFVKKANAELFEPCGYHATVLNTTKMMAQIGHEDRNIQLPLRAGLPPLPEANEDNIAYFAELAAQHQAGPHADGSMPNMGKLNLGGSSREDDPRLRRVRALEGYVQPLQLVETPPEQPDNWFKRWGARNAQKREEKQAAKQLRKQAKGDKKARKAERKQLKGYRKAAKIERKGEERAMVIQNRLQAEADPQRQAELLRDLELNRRDVEQDLAASAAKRDRKVKKRYGKSEKRGHKAEKKQQKVAQKIRWIVITATDDSALPRGDDVPVSSDEDGDDSDSDKDEHRGIDSDDEYDSSDMGDESDEFGGEKDAPPSYDEAVHPSVQAQFEKTPGKKN